MQLTIYSDPNSCLHHLVKVQLQVIISLVRIILIYTAHNIQKNLINNNTDKTTVQESLLKSTPLLWCHDHSSCFPLACSGWWHQASLAKPGSSRLPSRSPVTPSGLCDPCSDCVGVSFPCPGCSRSEASAGWAQARGHPAITATAGTLSRRGGAGLFWDPALTSAHQASGHVLVKAKFIFTGLHVNGYSSSYVWRSISNHIRHEKVLNISETNTCDTGFIWTF